MYLIGLCAMKLIAFYNNILINDVYIKPLAIHIRSKVLLCTYQTKYYVCVNLLIMCVHNGANKYECKDFVHTSNLMESVVIYVFFISISQHILCTQLYSSIKMTV